MIKNNRFTLIELLIVVVIIGVLAAVVVPNVSNFKQDSTTAAMQANISNIEKALTMYSMDNNGNLPVLKDPELGLPEPLLVDQLHPSYLRTKPKVKNMKYWVDETTKVWASSADSPIGIVYTTAGKLKWVEAENAVSYNVFKAESTATQSRANQQKVVFVKESQSNEVELPKLDGNGFYLVNSVDGFGLESPPASSEYQGNLIGSEIPETGLSQKEKFPWPMDMEEVKWKNNEPAMTDDDPNTYYTLKGLQEYVFEWQGDMANRVFKVRYLYNTNFTPKSFNFLDKDGKTIPFINAKTDARYETFNAIYDSPVYTMEFVVPRGATQFKIQPAGGDIRLYEANFVSDLSLPYPVENVTSETTKESMTLKWNPPTNAHNFSKVAIYDGDTFLGYSTTGTFTVNSLYSDKEYMYSIEPISVVGNRGPRVEHINKTVRPEIVFRGLDNAKAFDSLSTTSVPVKVGDTISWEGNLDNRQVNFTYGSVEVENINYIAFSFFDDEGNVLSSRRANNNELSDTQKLSAGRGSLKMSFIVPEGAKSLRFTSNPYSSRISIVSFDYGTSLELPSNLTQIKITPAERAMTFTFNRPPNVARVGVFRDGQFIAYTTEDVFTDTSLYSNRTYNYTFETFTSNGHKNPAAGATVAKTVKMDVSWSGLSNANAFDSSLTTSVSIKVGDVISWEGNLENRQINFTYGSIETENLNHIAFSFFDKDGKVVNSRAANSNDLLPTQTLTAARGTLKKSFVVPEGAVSLKFVSNPYSSRFSIAEVDYGNSLQLPSDLTDIKVKTNQNSVDFTFNRPADVTKVAVIRNGEFIAYTTNDTYSDQSLYSDTEYTYTIETFNGNGHRNPSAGNFKVKTIKPEIVWRGLDDAKAFDSLAATHSLVEPGKSIQWEGDLTNKQINLTYGSSTNYNLAHVSFSFYDQSGKVLKSRKALDNNLLDTHNLHGVSGTTTASYIVPEGATQIKFKSDSYAMKVRLYTVDHGTDLSSPSKLGNVTATSDKESVTLTFNRPADVARVGVFRDGTFVAYATGATFTDKPLYSNRAYTYTFETFSPNGHKTEDAGSIQVKTSKPEISWSGLDDASAFDSSDTTFNKVLPGAVIQWEGDLANKQINFTYTTSTNYHLADASFSFYDKDNKIISAKAIATNTVADMHHLRGVSGKTTTSFIVPEGATQIKFRGNSYALVVNLFNLDYTVQ